MQTSVISAFNALPDGPGGVLILVGAVLVAVFVGAVIGNAIRKKTAEKLIGSAEEEAKKIIADAQRLTEQKKKEALLEAKEEIIKSRNEAEKEIKDRRTEVTHMERRVMQKEENIDRKTENLEKKEEQINAKIRECDKMKEEIEKIKQGQFALLQEISGYTAEQAKATLLTKLEDEIRHEEAIKIQELEQEYKDKADSKAKDILAVAIQRCAADYVAEATVSVVALPNDDMKGRIIGREGRNIRAIETLTGVDLIIDDTPETITISSFNPVRREIARLSLEKLIADGRIHPSRIEECVTKARREVDNVIRQEGERAALETGVHGIHPELIKLLGRLRYRTSYGQNVLGHSIEVAYISGMIADELGVDSVLAKRAGLLHDIGKSLNHEIEGSHVQIGVDYARKYKENADVVHAIEAHHNDVEPKTVIAMIVQAADAISAARPGARRENVENYIKRLEKLEEICDGFNGVDHSYAIQAGREVRIMVKPAEINDDDMVIMARDIAKKIENELEYPGQIKVNLIRESRAVDVAK